MSLKAEMAELQRRSATNGHGAEDDINAALATPTDDSEAPAPVNAESKVTTWQHFGDGRYAKVPKGSQAQAAPVNSSPWQPASECTNCGGDGCWGMSNGAGGSYAACRSGPIKGAVDGEVRRTKDGSVFHVDKHYQASGKNAGMVSLPPLPGEIPAPPANDLDVICMSDVEAKEVEWLWPGYIPKSMVTLLAGQPGLGKSFWTMYLAAILSRGDFWPTADSGPAPKGKTIILSGEDALEHTIKPRLDRMCADSSKVFCVRGVSEKGADGKKRSRAVRLDIDLAQLELLLKTHPDVVAIIIDPVDEYLGKSDSHKSAEVRGITGPLAALAETYGIAIILVTHFSKSGHGPAIYKALGSIAFVAMARAAYAFIRDAEDQDRVLVLPLKMNIAKRPPGLAYRIVDGLLKWEDGEVHMTADEALAAQSAPKKDGSQQDKCAAWLLTRLADGNPIESNELADEAKNAGFSFATYKRARADLKERDVKCSKGSGENRDKWFVRLEAPLEPTEILERDAPLDPLTQEAHESQENQEDQGVQEAHMSGEW